MTNSIESKTIIKLAKISQDFGFNFHVNVKLVLNVRKYT